MAKVLDANFDNKNKAGARPVKWSSANHAALTERLRGVAQVTEFHKLYFEGLLTISNIIVSFSCNESCISGKIMFLWAKVKSNNWRSHFPWRKQCNMDVERAQGGRKVRLLSSARSDTRKWGRSRRSRGCHGLGGRSSGQVQIPHVVLCEPCSEKAVQ